MMQRPDSGLTTVELMIVTAIMIPLFAAIAGISSMVTKTIDANEQSSEVIDHLRRTVARLSQFLRPARLSSIEILSIQEDVDLGLATSVGEWISPTDLAPRSSVRFLAAEGLLSMNAQLSTPPREMLFELDAGETANGQDDDGDGLIDEGSLLFRTDTSEARFGSFERCDFTLDGPILRLRLSGAKRDAQGRMYRATIEHAFYIRNT